MLFVQFGWVLFSVIMSFGAYKLCLHRPSIALFLHMQKEYTQLEFTWYTHSMYAFMYGEYVNCKRSVLVLFAFCYNYLCRRWKTILTHTHKHMQNTVDWRATATATSFGHQQKKQYTKPIPILLFSYLGVWRWRWRWSWKLRWRPWRRDIERRWWGGGTGDIYQNT